MEGPFRKRELLTIQKALKELFFFSVSPAVRAQDIQTHVACESWEMSDVLFIGPREMAKGRSAGALCAWISHGVGGLGSSGGSVQQEQRDEILRLTVH